MVSDLKKYIRNIKKRVRMGAALAVLGRKIGLTNEDFEVFEKVRDKTPAKPMRFK